MDTIKPILTLVEEMLKLVKDDSGEFLVPLIPRVWLKVLDT